MRRFHSLSAIALLILMIAAPATHAQDIERNLRSYAEDNAVGYLNPLRDAFASGMSDGLFTSAHIPTAKPYVRLDLRAMIMRFGDDDKTFQARTPSYFPSNETYEVPTVVGSGEETRITDTCPCPPGTGLTYPFPGGLDLDGLPLAVPQLVAGGIMGSEAILRYFTAEIGDAEIGDINLFGIGARHSINQYLPGLPLSLSAMVFFQKFKVGDDFVDFNQLSFGVQASKRFLYFEPYAGVGYDRSSMSLEYDYDDGSGSLQKLNVDFDDDNRAHLTLGAALRFFLVHLNGEVNISEQTSYAIGLSVGN